MHLVLDDLTIRGAALRTLRMFEGEIRVRKGWVEILDFDTGLWRPNKSEVRRMITDAARKHAVFSPPQMVNGRSELIDHVEMIINGGWEQVLTDLPDAIDVYERLNDGV